MLCGSTWVVVQVSKLLTQFCPITSTCRASWAGRRSLQSPPQHLRAHMKTCTYIHCALDVNVLRTNTNPIGILGFSDTTSSLVCLGQLTEALVRTISIHIRHVWYKRFKLVFWDRFRLLLLLLRFSALTIKLVVQGWDQLVADSSVFLF